MMAALWAVRAETEVLLLEKSTRRGCNTELSGGLIQAAGTRLQAALGVDDSPQLMWSDILRKNKGKCDPDVVRAVCDRSAEVVHFLADRVGLPLHLDTNVHYYGHSAFRMHATHTETGSEIVTGLRNALADEPAITLVDEVNVRGLVRDQVGVVGVDVERGGRERIEADCVLLACDGFGGNRDMLRRFCPEIAEAAYIGSENNTGDGIRWGEQAGAALDLMTAYQGHSHVNPMFGTRLGGMLPNLGSIMVNLDGRRFEREDQGYSEFARVVLAQPGAIAVEIFDERIFEIAWNTGSFREAFEAGAIKKADTIAGLAQQLSLPKDALEGEIEDFNQGARTGRDRLGRSDLRDPLEPPLYGSIVTGAIAHTQGGLRIDSFCRALRPDGTFIRGLWAAGGTAAGISGDGADGYMSGNGLIQAFSTGLIAAEMMVQVATENAVQGSSVTSGPSMTPT